MTEATPFQRKYDITFLCPPTIVAGQLVQLGDEGVVNAFCGHIKKSPCNRSRVQMDALHLLARRAVSGASPQKE